MENTAEFKNIRAVADYLITQGWKVSEKSVYNHAKAGMLGKKKNGVYTARQVQQYARDYLTTEDFHQTRHDDDLSRKKLLAEIQYKAEQGKLVRLKREVEEGKYVLRTEVERQLAGRAALFETGFKGKIRTGAGDLIKLVQGDPVKTPDLIYALYAYIDEELNRYARRVEFEITIHTEEMEEDESEE